MSKGVHGRGGGGMLCSPMHDDWSMQARKIQRRRHVELLKDQSCSYNNALVALWVGTVRLQDGVPSKCRTNRERRAWQVVIDKHKPHDLSSCLQCNCCFQSPSYPGW